MGRIFEVRKATMFARWNRMAKQFARIAKDITMAAKAAGPDPASNPTLRRFIHNARAVNMPKDKIEAAIKRASGRDAAHYQQVIYEGYAPHGVALLVETATDNPTRTVAGVRNLITKNGGNLAISGVNFIGNTAAGGATGSGVGGGGGGGGFGGNSPGNSYNGANGGDLFGIGGQTGQASGGPGAGSDATFAPSRGFR